MRRAARALPAVQRPISLSRLGPRVFLSHPPMCKSGGTPPSETGGAHVAASPDRAHLRMTSQVCRARRYRGRRVAGRRDGCARPNDIYSRSGGERRSLRATSLLQAVVMAALVRGARGRWRVDSFGAPASGNVKQYAPLRAALARLQAARHSPLRAALVRLVRRACGWAVTCRLAGAPLAVSAAPVAIVLRSHNCGSWSSTDDRRWSSMVVDGRRCGSRCSGAPAGRCRDCTRARATGAAPTRCSPHSSTSSARTRSDASSPSVDSPSFCDLQPLLSFC